MSNMAFFNTLESLTASSFTVVFGYTLSLNLTPMFGYSGVFGDFPQQ